MIPVSCADSLPAVPKRRAIKANRIRFLRLRLISTLLELIGAADKNVMRHQRPLVLCMVGSAALAVASAGLAATFGEVVSLAGQASDLALDEPRNALYAANFTAGRIDVVSLTDHAVRTSMHVSPGPSSLALSKDGRYLVVTHFGNVQAPASPGNAITVLDLTTGGRQSYVTANPPLGVAFGADGLALVVTTSEFLLLNPVNGVADLIDTVEDVTASSLPAAPGTPPVQILATGIAASRDGRWIFGLTDTFRFSYDVNSRRVAVGGYTATPPLGPRVVSVAGDGSYYAAGWGVFARNGPLLAQYANAAGLLAVGSLALDSSSNTLYAQIPETPKVSKHAAAPPVLSIMDADNLTVRERLRLPENLAGRAVFNAVGDTIYAVSESGVLILPVGSTQNVHRVAADREDVVFQGNFCQRGAMTRTVRIVDPGGGQTSFAVQSDLPGVTISPASGRTPATLQITIDPAAFADRRGTVVGSLTITSAEAVNIPAAVRVLLNNRRPDERGTSTNIPGTLSDLLSDPVRDRFYVLRQDRNQVLVFDGSGFFQVAALRSSNTPTRMAITFDRKYLLVGHDNSQLVYVYDLDTLDVLPPVVLPPGHYPRSIAASSNAILVASRVAGSDQTIDRIDLISRTATTLPSLGVFKNSIAADTVLVSTPNGGAIMGASSDGMLLLYDASVDTFTVSRKVGNSLSGAYAASTSGLFLVGSTLLNSSLVPLASLATSDFTSGFAFSGGQGVRLAGPASASGAGGVLERLDLSTGSRIRPTRLAEQPLVTGGLSAFTRTLMPLSNQSALVALTTSGFTAVPWNFDAAVVPPVIQQVVNAADLTSNVAAGSLITVFGTDLNPINAVTQEMPLPTAIGESCLTANGAAIPMMFASPRQLNAQMPLHLEGRVTMTLYTPGGVSADYYVNVLPIAPAVFLSGTAGPLTDIPVVIKASNRQLVTPSNPIHGDDAISIYATGMGSTAPEVEAGAPPPASPPALLVAPADVRLGGVSLAVSYAGLAPGQVGVYRIDAKVPPKPPTGMDIPLTVAGGGVSTAVNVRVVE
jgi:uncharacterized protein (TIGR03437 family)